MFVITMTRKKILRLVFIISAVVLGAVIVIYAILSAVNAHAQGGKLPIYSVARSDNKIAMTFDVAWENSNTDELIEILEKENVKATFFITGDWCDRYPDDVLKFFQAGHEIQNHSDAHPHINGMNVNDLIADTKEASRKIEMITNTPPTLYRTPYGEYDEKSLTTLEGMGLKVIQWDADSIDWKKVTSDEIIKRIEKRTKSGSILLFHNDLENTTQALPQLIKNLKAKGFEFAKVSDLIYHEDYTIDHTGNQIYQDPSDVSSILTFLEKEKANQVLNSENGDRIKEIAAKYLTADEIASLKDGITPDLLQGLLNKMSDEDKTEILRYLSEENQSTSHSTEFDKNQPKDGTMVEGTEDFSSQLPESLPPKGEVIATETGAVTETPPSSTETEATLETPATLFPDVTT